MSQHHKIIIAGGGIAGLAVALALSKAGLQSLVVEAASEPAQIGAGIQLSPNACHALGQIGALDVVRKNAIAPEAIILADAKTGNPLLQLPVNDIVNAKRNIDGSAHAPFLTITRAALHKALYDLSHQDQNISLLMGERVETVSKDSKSVHIQTLNNKLTANLLIGADGVWSKTRSALANPSPARPTGRIAFRALATTVEQNNPVVTAYLAPKTHFVSYPLIDQKTGLTARNYVAITKGHAASSGWSTEVSNGTKASLHATFASAVNDVSLDALDWSAWPVFAEPAKAKWSDGERIILIGDAAHAMEPYAAQGAAMALEDAVVLANSIAHTNGNEQALQSYEVNRRQRISRVMRRTAFNRHIYHLSKPASTLRNLAFQMRSPQSFLADLDWLYGFRA